MANTPTKLIVDCTTGESQTVPLTDEEIAEREQLHAEAEQLRLAEEAAAQAKADAIASAIAKLTALGLTEAEALALVGQ
jgi:hypothetical protein